MLHMLKMSSLETKLFCVMQSESNVQHILISDPKDGVTSYGLTEEGKKQAKQVCITAL